jgi:UDPglucose 6-dehydrogenase
MKIGIVGLGIVGSAIKYGFAKLGHEILEHDIRFQTKLEDVTSAEVVFICVPSPSDPNGECNTSIVEQVVAELCRMSFQGVIAIKSTVTPGTTRELIKRHNNNNICFVPEFLRERCAVADFVEKHDLCVIGTEIEEVFQKIQLAHGKLPRKIAKLPPTEAEFVKYFNNIYNATLVVFANSMYEVCKSVGADYSAVKDTVVKRDHINDIYLDCNDNFRGFGGMCLPKDTRAIACLAKRRGTNIEFFANLLNENSKFRTTVLPGMRGGTETSIYEIDAVISKDNVHHEALLPREFSSPDETLRRGVTSEKPT